MRWKLTIEDFVLLERLELELGPGLTVLTGGSGEGKTLVVRALGFLFGEGCGRGAAARLVRPGAGQARVALELEPGPGARAWLVARGLPTGPRVVVERALERGGRSRARVGEVALDAAALRELGAHVVEVFGQGEAAALADEARQRALVDAYAGCAADALAYARAREAALGAARQRDLLLAEEDRGRLEAARWQEERAALADLEPEPGEYEALLAEVDALARAEEDAATCEALRAALSEDDGAVEERLRAALGRLDGRGGARRAGPRAAAPPACRDRDDDGGDDPATSAATRARDAARAALEQALALVADATASLERARDAVEIDAARLACARERLARWRQLARRLRTSPEALAARWAELAAVEDPEALAARRAVLDREVVAGVAALDRAAEALARARAEAGTRLAAAASARLEALGLSAARLGFEHALEGLTDGGSGGEHGAGEAADPAGVVARREAGAEAALLRRHPGPGGRDRLRLVFASGPELAAGPLARASGGELSRLFLALAAEVGAGRADLPASQSAGRADHPAAQGPELGPLLVFDEVDQNVGARLGAATGACLARIAAGRPVLSVTHLAPVAARADHHLRIVRQGGRSEVERLEGASRTDELALMIRGAPLTPASREQARELLSEAAAERARLADASSPAPAAVGGPVARPRARTRAARSRARVAS